MKDLTMNKLTQKIRNFLRDEEGLSAVEYVVAGSLLVVGVSAAFTSLSDAIKTSVATIISYL
jgi:pilus assembly protein Flp/PilA